MSSSIGCCCEGGEGSECEGEVGEGIAICGSSISISRICQFVLSIAKDALI
jgi:hypothetical protein